MTQESDDGSTAMMKNHLCRLFSTDQHHRDEPHDDCCSDTLYDWFRLSAGREKIPDKNKDGTGCRKGEDMKLWGVVA